jgi:peptidyl-prolyl cis-trans isomerase A (cyclophilin A)
MAIGFVVAATAIVVAQADKLKDPGQLVEPAPASYRARFDTSQGTFVIQVHRDWAPLAADRFYNLVKNGFYDGTRFFRVRPGFMAQFGLHGDPAVSSAWRTANLRDEKPTQSNTRGKVSFTQESTPNTRFTMVFINYADNSYLDANGFAPFGEVTSGMPIVDKLNGEYGNSPDQRRIVREGNAYLSAEFPRLDSIKKAAIEK